MEAPTVTLEHAGDSCVLLAAGRTTLGNELSRCLREPSYQSVFDWPGEWLIVQANPQRLQHVVDTIEGFEVPVYWPRVSVWQSNGDKRRSGLKPLFPGGYLFPCLPSKSYWPDTLRDWGISTLREISGQDRFRKEISMIQQCIGADKHATLYPGLSTGITVEVARGAYRGLVGRIIQLNDVKGRLILICTIMGAGASVEVNMADVDPVVN